MPDPTLLLALLPSLLDTPLLLGLALFSGIGLSLLGSGLALFSGIGLSLLGSGLALIQKRLLWIVST